MIVTDPCSKADPLTPPEYKNLEALGKVDLLLVTHRHLEVLPLKAGEKAVF